MKVGLTPCRSLLLWGWLWESGLPVEDEVGGGDWRELFIREKGLGALGKVDRKIIGIFYRISG